VNKTETTRAAVEEAATALAQKIVTAADENQAQAAVSYAEALADTCRGLSSIAEAQRDDRAEDD
jgi:hypothetical protein